MNLLNILPDPRNLVATSVGTTSNVYTVVPDLEELLSNTGEQESPSFNTGSDIDGKELSLKTEGIRNIPEVSQDNASFNELRNSESGGYELLYYPAGLLDGSTLGKRYPHAIGIFINVNSKSKLGKYMAENDGYIAKKRLDGITDLTGSTAEESVTSVQTTPGNIANFLSDRGIIATFKRFTGCVLLPIPLDVKASYAASYNTSAAGGILGTALKDALGGGNAAGLKDTINEYATGIGRDLTKSAASTLLKSLSGTETGEVTNPGGIFDKIVGTVRNPRTEQIFNQMQHRVWNLRWQVAITTVNEWNTVRKIISLLKENMHPELDYTPKGTYMVMPNEFDLEFYEKGENGFSESKTLPRIATCVMNNLDVNYTPNGHWIAFEGTMIPPFAIIETTFTEMEPLHRGMVRDIAETSGYTFSAPDSDFSDTRKGF